MIKVTKNNLALELDPLINRILNEWKELLIETNNWNVVMVSQKEFENLKEHLHIAKNKQLIKRIHDSDNHRFESHETIESLKNELDN